MHILPKSTGNRLILCLFVIPITLFISIPHTYTTGDFGAQLSRLGYYQANLTEYISGTPQINFNDLSEQKTYPRVFYPTGPIHTIELLSSLGIAPDICLRLLSISCYATGIVFIVLTIRLTGVPKTTLLIIGLVLSTTCMFKKGLNPFVLNTADLFGFCILSCSLYWSYYIIKLISHKERGEITICNLILCSLALGSVYFFKYSQFNFACAAFSALLITYIKYSLFNKRMCFSITLSSICFLGTFILVNWYNTRLFGTNAIEFTMGNFINNSPYVQTHYGNYYAEASSGKLLAISTLAGPGWLNFGTPLASDLVYYALGSHWITNLANDSLHINANVAVSSTIGICFTLAILIFALTKFRNLQICDRIFFAALIIIPTILLAINSSHVGYNRLVSHEGRFGLPVSVLAEGLLVAYVVQCITRRRHVPIATILALAFIMYPLAQGLSSYLDFHNIAYANNEDSGKPATYPGTFGNTEESDRLTKQKVRELSKEGNECIVISGITDHENTKLFCHDQIDLAFSRKTIKLRNPRDIENEIFNTFGTSNDTTIIVFLHKYYTDFNKLPSQPSWASIGSGFHFEPRKRLPSAPSRKRDILDKESYLNLLKSKFINSGPIHTIDILNSNFHIAYFKTRGNPVEKDS